MIVGVGEVVGPRSSSPDTAVEPMDLILAAVREAAADCGVADPAGVLRAVDAVHAVRTTSWSYATAAATLAARVGATPRHTADTTVGGHWPARLLDDAAARLAAGESDVALVVGGEAQATVTALAKAGIDPVADLGWSREPGGPPAFDPEELGTAAMRDSGVVLPTRVYPLFQQALDAVDGLPPARAAARAAATFARLTEVAAVNPIAWDPRVRSAEDVGTPRPDNRMICEPYPKALNAMPHVDQAAAVLVMSAAAARARGIAEDRWVHVRGGAGATDSADVLARPSFARSGALATAFDRALDRAEVDAADLDLVDVYSCFPVVPLLVAHHLGAGDRVLSATGGHAAFGGPLSSYSLHAIAAVTRQLREGRARTAAVHANGGYLTHQHVVVLSRRPARAHAGDPDPVGVDADGVPPFVDARDLVAGAGGPVPATIETWTVEHSRDGGPATAIVVARTRDGVRTAATTAPGDVAAAAALSRDALGDDLTTHIGRPVRLVPAGDGVAVDPSPTAQERT